MVVCGLVINLDEGHTEVGESIRCLEGNDKCEIGSRFGPRLAVVTETEDAMASEAWHLWAAGLPGVLHIEVAFVEFADEAKALEHAAQSQKDKLPCR